MNILISGSHGLIGSALASLLAGRGDRIVRLVRPGPASGPQEVGWDPAAGTIDGRALEGVDAAIHLAGESAARGRWTAAKKARIRESRVESTRLLARTLAGLTRRPRVLICASAVGYYGDRGDEILVEESAPGQGFLAGVCVAWEAAAEAVRQAGIRVVHLRTGLVLTPTGGALAQLLPLFRLGLGGRFGSGRQWMSWITLDDEVEAIAHPLGRNSLQGPVNLVSPHPVTNQEPTNALARVLRRPAVLALPGAALRAVIGEAAGELVGDRKSVV